MSSATTHRILVAHRDAEHREHLCHMLESIGHQVIGSVGTCSEVVTIAAERSAEVIVSSLYLVDGDGIDALVEASRTQPIPSVIVTPRTDLEHVTHALEDHVMAYLVEPVSSEDLRPTIMLVVNRFEQFQDLQKEVDDLKSALRARKTIEKAKGLLMKHKGLDEPTAYRMLQTRANEQRRKMLEVAEEILSTDSV